MITIKKAITIAAAMLALLCMSIAARAYNIVDLPATMKFDEASGIFSADDITRATISNYEERSYVELSREQISSLYDGLKGMTLTRGTNPIPFRGTSLNMFAADGSVKSFYVGSGMELGLYGTGNYICYTAENEEDQIFITNIETMYQDSDQKQYGEDFYRTTANNFLTLPQDAWAHASVREAAANNLMPYEFTKKYSDNISREEFCVLLANLIDVVGNYASLEKYLDDKGMVYYTNAFSDCEGRDNSIFMLNALGIVSGREADRFDPDGAVTREEAAALLCRTAEQFIYIQTYGSLNFADANYISSWAKYFALWASEQNIMNGNDGYFLPKENYTVLQAIATVNRLYKVIMRTLNY